VKAYINRAVGLAKSESAKDTYVLFAGNLASAFLGFLFTVMIARGLSVGDFGVFSAINNLVTIISSLSDVGISAGLVAFVANFEAKGESESSHKFLKASLIARVSIVSVLSLAILAFAPLVSRRLLATDDKSMVVWSVILSFGLLVWGYFPYALRAYRRFIASIVVELSLGITRVFIIATLLFMGILTLQDSLLGYALGCLVALFVGFYFLKTTFLKAKVDKHVYSKLLSFSGWVGLNQIVSAISGRLDVQMLAFFSGATITGLYSISSRLALFITVLVASFSTVLATRLAGFEDKEKEKQYLVKATLATVPMILGVVLWILIAQPFITILFGEKYLPAVPLFQGLAVALLPFLASTVPVTAIIYAIKKPIYIGYFSFFQLAAIFLINLVLIPKIGGYGPIIAFLVVHCVLAIFSWFIVVRHYWARK
jgi:O-antigen/teichoic acid export membrane protein